MLVSLQDVENGVEQARTTADSRRWTWRQTGMSGRFNRCERRPPPSPPPPPTPPALESWRRRGLSGNMRPALNQSRHSGGHCGGRTKTCDLYLTTMCARKLPATAARSCRLAASGSGQPRDFCRPAAQQPPATANLATFVVPAATQPPAPANSAVSTALAAMQPLGTTTPAAARPSATTAPAVIFSARTNMPPPAPREPSTSTTPWSVVVSSTHRQPPHQPPYAAPDDTYLNLRISKLMFKNKHFPFDLRLPIKDLASNVNTALALFHGSRFRLRFALQLVTQDRPPLCDGLVDGILHLRDLLERAYATPDGARWVRETLRDAAAPHRPDRTESSASDSSTTTGQRRREEPSSG